MKKLFSPTFFILLSFCWFSVFSQVKIVDYDDLPAHLKAKVIPDVNGKVLIGQASLSEPIPSVMLSDTIYPFPGWPVRIAGVSQRGGIACNIDTDNDLEIIYNIGSKVYAFNIDNSNVPGWPKTVTNTPAEGAPAFGDIDGDGIGEIIVTTRTPGTANTGKIYAFKWDGSAVTGFPVTCYGGPVRTPVLADLDNDGILEIIIEERKYPDGFVNVYKGDGTVMPGWPQQMDYIPASAVAVGDITGDDIPEIVAESYYSVYAYGKDGNLLEGFPFTPGNNRVFSYSSPVLADIDGDGLRDIIVGDHSLTAGNGQVHVLNSNGQPLSGFPRTVSYWIYAPASVANIDGLGGLDIVIGDQVLAGSPVDKLYAWSSDGTYVTGFPVTGLNAINSQALIADIDGDFMYEIMIDDNTGAGVYRAFNHDGTEHTESGWPLSVIGSTFFMNPLITDLNFDGKLDFIGGGNEITVEFTNLYLWDLDLAYAPYSIALPVLQYNNQHTGVYGQIDTLYVGINNSDHHDLQDVMVFPILVSHELNIMMKTEQPAIKQVELFDLTGRLGIVRYFSGDQKVHQLSISTSGLEPGLYLVRVINQQNSQITRRIIKIK